MLSKYIQNPYPFIYWDLTAFLIDFKKIFYIKYTDCCDVINILLRLPFKCNWFFNMHIGKSLLEYNMI